MLLRRRRSGKLINVLRLFGSCALEGLSVLRDASAYHMSLYGEAHSLELSPGGSLGS